MEEITLNNIIKEEFNMKKIISVVLVIIILFSFSINVMAAQSNNISFEKELNSKEIKEHKGKWSIIGYDLMKEKEIFGEMSKAEIHDVLLSLLHDEFILNSNNKIDYSQIIIINSDSDKKIERKRIKDNITLNDNSPFPLSMTFRYMVEFDLGTGSSPINYYLTTVTRFPIKIPYRIGIKDMRTRPDPSWPFNVDFHVKETIDGALGYVVIHWKDVMAINAAKFTFEVLDNGKIIMY